MMEKMYKYSFNNDKDIVFYDEYFDETNKISKMFKINLEIGKIICI